MTNDIQLLYGNCLELLPKIFDNSMHRNAIIVTDPPFNVGYHYRQYNDKMSESNYYAMLKTIVSYAPNVIIHYPESLHRLSIELGKAPERVISWVYNSNTAKQHRDIAFYGIAPLMNQVKQPYKNPTDKRVKALIAKGHTGAKLYDWWNVNQVKNVSKDKTEHPCQMPIEVMKNIVGILPKDCLIIDPFMGSGTTGVAVATMNQEQEANRSFIGIELDSHYYEIAKNRCSVYI